MEAGTNCTAADAAAAGTCPAEQMTNAASANPDDEDRATDTAAAGSAARVLGMIGRAAAAAVAAG